jgi:hypothetical protein
VYGSGPITIGKQNGIWTVGLSIAAFGSIVPPVQNFPTDYLMGWDAANNAYFKVSITNLATAVATFIIPQSLSLKTFGAIGNGVADDTAAVLSWLSALQSAPTPCTGYAPAGNYIFKSPLSVGAGGKNDVTIAGDGPYTTIFTYAGSSTTPDLLTIGDGSTQCVGWSLHDFRITSNTIMTSGAGLKMNSLGRSTLDRIILDGQDGSGKLFNGMYFNGASRVNLSTFEARGSASAGTALAVRGIHGAANSDLIVTGGKLSLSNKGLVIGGDFGGFEMDDTDLNTNNFNMVIDQSLAAFANRQLFFGKGVTCDVCLTGPNVHILDVGDAESLCEFTGTWIASSPNTGLLIGPGCTYRIDYTGGVITNNLTDGVFDQSGGTADIHFTGTRVDFNGGWGFSASGASVMELTGIRFGGNASGNVSIPVNGIPAGGDASAKNNFFPFGNGIGIYYGSNVPTLSVGQGSLYLRTDGAAGTAIYYNTAAGSNWVAVT